MTRDAFEKAKELDKKLTAVHNLTNVISNSTLSADEDYHAMHNEHVIKDKMVLCYMCKPSDTYEADINIPKELSNFDGIDKVSGDYHMGGNFVLGKDIPVDLVECLERVINEYEWELRKEFEALSGDYTEDDEETPNPKKSRKKAK